MYLHPYQINGKFRESRWVNVAEHDNQKKKRNLLFIYIGTNTNNFQSVSNHFRYSLFSENYNDAENLIEKGISENEKNPDAIFIDTILNKDDLKQFLHFLKQKGLLNTMPIIYNQNRLSHHNIKYLKRHPCIDDITDFSSENIDFRSKVYLLKQMREQLCRQDFSKRKNEEKVSFSKNFSHTFKRSFDIAISLTALLVALPVLLLIALAIKLESKGPVFYISKRAGKGYRIIRFYKFRSMTVDADKKIEHLSHLNQYNSNDTGAKFFKLNNDPRVTKVGKFLRNTSLDELPQLLNVLKGDMSIVGNRPLPLYEAETLTTNYFVERFTAPAGITGLWQVKKRGKPDMSIDERIDLDISYARNNNFLFDMGIIFSTPKALFQKSDV